MKYRLNICCYILCGIPKSEVDYWIGSESIFSYIKKELLTKFCTTKADALMDYLLTLLDLMESFASYKYSLTCQNKY